jgi:ABC-type nitrate/sulfonate/bicarbonate transport system substrate-binding protein
MSTRLKLALALGALTLLPAAGAQAATATPTALTFSSSLGVTSAPETVIYSVTAADARPRRVAIDGETFQHHPITQTNDCDSLPASGSGQCAVSVTFTPDVAGTTTHATLAFTDGVSITYASASLTGVAAPAAGGKGKKCHKKGKKASAAKKCKKKKH